MGTISKLVVHHSASSKASTTKEKITQWHSDKGISPIGYHKLITDAGVIQDGRSETTMGAHAKGANTNSLGVCLFGDFETEVPSQKQIDSLVNVLETWCKKYSIKGDCSKITEYAAWWASDACSRIAAKTQV